MLVKAIVKDAGNLPRSLRLRLRRRAALAVVDNFFVGLGKLGALHPLSDPEKHDVERFRDVPYRDGGGKAHALDVYRPKNAKEKLPVVLYVHGGGFRIMSKDSHWLMGIAFATHGYLAFNVNYRLAPKHRFPAAVEDVCAAYEWVCANAERYGGDTSRIVLAGESAGANLVTSLTVATCYERNVDFAKRVFDTGIVPRAVAPACGMLQVSDSGRFSRKWPNLMGAIDDQLREVTRSYLGPNPPDDQVLLDFADPLLVFERGDAPARSLPPFFIPCGTKDPLVDDSKRLERALAAMQVECEAQYYPGELHAFHAVVLRAPAQACWRHQFHFLHRHVPGSHPPRKRSHVTGTDDT